QTAAQRPGQRGVSDGLRRVPLSGRIYPRARQLPGFARGRFIDGSTAVAAHDRDRRDYFCVERKKIEPWIDTLTVSVLPSNGTLALAAEAIAIARGAAS